MDLHSRKAYGASHFTGTVSLGLDGPMATWLGWMIEWGSPITLLGDSVDQVAQAQRELVRIGIDKFAAAATGQPDELAVSAEQLRTMPTASFGDLAQALASAPVELPRVDVVLDVRTNSEWRDSHVDNAVHIPLYELKGRISEVPDGTMWVHCGSGYRATAAAALLEQAGRNVVLIYNLFGHAREAGVPVTTQSNRICNRAELTDRRIGKNAFVGTPHRARRFYRIRPVYMSSPRSSEGAECVIPPTAR